eukprot:1388338-Amorphochlora_amoeboformis.AAC.1
MGVVGSKLNPLYTPWAHIQEHYHLPTPKKIGNRVAFQARLSPLRPARELHFRRGWRCGTLASRVDSRVVKTIGLSKPYRVVKAISGCQSHIGLSKPAGCQSHRVVKAIGDKYFFLRN